MSNNTTAIRLLCPSCEPPDGGAGSSTPCPCDLSLCDSERCRELYKYCAAIFACQNADNGTQDSFFSGQNHEANLDWYFLAFAVTLMAAGAVGNVLVCLAVSLDRALQNSTNYFLLSLAAADLIVSLCVMPLGAIPGFLGHWPLGVGWCSVYVTSDVLACSSSILHMCVISLGRYLGIRSPLRARHRTSKRLLAKKIASVWLLAALISSSITVLGAYDRTNIMPSEGQCNINNRAFSLFGSVASFYAPMLLMVGSYALTLHLLRRKARFGAKARAERLLQQATSRPPPPTSSQVSTRPLPVPQQEQQMANGRPLSGNGVQQSVRKKREPPPRTLRLRAPSQLRLSEHKASTVLGLVFASFVLCWAPFFVLNVLTAVCPRCASPSPSLVSVCLWLGYGSSTINPIIYTVFNRSFRAALFRLLRCQGTPPPPVRFRATAEYRSSSMGATPSTPGPRGVVTSFMSTRPSTTNNATSTFPATFDILH